MSPKTQLLRKSISGAGTITAALALFISLLAPTSAAAQNIHEILIGSLGDIPTDEFRCGRKGQKPRCGLSYRYYAIDEPDEINGPAAELDGRPSYNHKLQLYVADPVHTGNFPAAATLGADHVWNLVWDGVKNAKTPGHIGYYAAVSQIVTRNELGNPLSPTCLPVTGQYACFGRSGADRAALIQNTPLGEISPLGGLSPTPVPLVIRNGTESVSFVWEQASAQQSRDGAPLPIEGYQLYLFSNPVTPPGEPELHAHGMPVGEVMPLTTTALDLPRSTGALADSVTVSAAIRLVYLGGVESLHFSANGQTTGLAFPDTAATAETDDAAAAGAGGVSRAIDIEHLFLEIRQHANADEEDESVFFATVDLVGEPIGNFIEGTTVRLFIDFNDEGLADGFAEPGKENTEDITLTATLSREEGEPVTARFTGLPGIDGQSTLDTKHARVVFAVPLDQLTGAVSNAKLRAADIGDGKRRVLVWAETTRDKDRDRVPNTNDGGAPTVSGEVVKFTF